MKLIKNRISLRGLRTFCIVARRGSFRGAAEDLFLTPSAISHQIKNLESELEVTLFDRGARSLRLTEAAEMLFQESSPLIEKLDEVASRFCTLYGQRTLRVSAQPFFASELLVPRLSDFIGKNPGITIDINTEDQASEKHPGAADISIRLFRKPPANLNVYELFPLRLVPACSPALARQLSWNAKKPLAGLPLIVHSKRPNAWRQWAHSAGVEVGSPSGVIRLETMISVARAAEQGVGLALMPLPLSESWFRSGSLVKLYDHELLTPDRYFAATREEDSQRSEVRTFRNWVLQEFGQSE